MRTRLPDNEFVVNLQLEKEAIKNFVAILKSEQNALVQGNIEDLDCLTSQKNQLIKTLTEFGDKRSQYLHTIGLSIETQCINKLLATDKTENNKTKTVWDELLQLAKTAKQLNQINGTLITARLQQSQQALAAMQNAAGAVSLYGPKGQTMAFSG